VLDKDLGARPDKERSKMKKEDFFTHNSDKYFDAKKLDDNTQKKIDRHLTIMRTTDDENEYKQHYDAFRKLIGAHKDTSSFNIQKDFKQLSGNANRTDTKPSEDAKKNKFVHTSNVDGLTKLTPSLRSRDGVLYKDKRVYFSTDKPMSSYGGKGNDRAQYEYDGKKRANAKSDPELNGGTSVYISTKDAIPVKQIKKQKEN